MECFRKKDLIYFCEPFFYRGETRDYLVRPLRASDREKSNIYCSAAIREDSVKGPFAIEQSIV